MSDFHESMRILICDDNADAAQTLGALLGSERHETFICQDGHSCIENSARMEA